MDKYDVEELILTMAEIVCENRELEKEVTRLQKIEKEYHQSIVERVSASEDASRNMLRAALVGINMEKNGNELA